MNHLPWIISACLAASAWGQNAETPPPASEPSPLAGPSASEPEARPTLVHRSYDGRLVRLDTTPWEAALALLELDEAARARADALVAERAADVDAIVVANIESLVKIKAGNDAGEPGAAYGESAGLARKFRELDRAGSMEDRLAETLDPLARDEFRRLLDEYHDAAFEDRKAEVNARESTRLERRDRAIRARERLEIVGVEIRQSYERTIVRAGKDYERTLASLNLRPEQEGEIRRMVTDQAQATKLNPTDAQRRELFFKILARLDEDQRRALLEAAAGR